MIYHYIHDEDGDVIEVEIPIADEKPKQVERDGKSYRFMWPWEGVKDVAIHIPEGFGSSDNSFNYDKRPSGKKRYF